MRLSFCAATLALLVVVPLSACGQEGRASTLGPDAAFRVGQYDDAIRAANQVLQQDSSNSRAGTVLLRSLIAVGKPGEATATAERLTPHGNQGLELALHAAEAFAAQGKLSDARAAYTRALGGSDSLLARYHLALLAFEAGQQEQAMREFDSFIDVYNDNRPRLSANDLRAIALACKMLGREDPQLFRDALRAFDEAIARDSSDLTARVELGELFLEKFNGTEARSSLEAVLRVNPRHPRALVAMARVHSFEGSSGSAELLQKSLEVNSANPEARALTAMQLIDVERYADAAAEAQKGLANDAGAPAPLIALAAARWLSADTAGFKEAIDRAHQRLQGSAQAEVTLADVAARNRLYRQAAEFAQAGIERDPKSARALAQSGINLMRLGQINEGSQRLDRAFALDPYDVWTKNTLDLVDTFKDYTEIKTPRFVIAVEAKDAPLMEIFARPLSEEAYDSLAARYDFKPTTPVRIEMFRSHADFSVRTVGLAGLGALGVSFGGVVAMDSPAARDVGEFNWGSTLWHELGHTFTLGASGNRVPRWFSEGLSVYEERRARVGWGSDISPQLIAAYESDRLHPVSRLNDGFVRPRYPEEVTLSYALASFVCEMIEAEKGVAAIRGLLSAYRRGLNTSEAFKEVLGRDMEAMDREFDQWFRRRFAGEFDAVDPAQGREEGSLSWDGKLRSTMERAVAAASARQWDYAIGAFEEAKQMFPSFAGQGSAYHRLADIYLQRGDSAKAAAEFTAIAERNESAFEENLMLSRLLAARGDLQGAVNALERSLMMTPFNIAVHDTLATLASRAGRHEAAIRSRRAVLALDPSDRVEAQYQLAKAYADAGDATSARREVLRALDLAPNYEKAQALLLELRQPEARP